MQSVPVSLFWASEPMLQIFQSTESAVRQDIDHFYACHFRGFPGADLLMAFNERTQNQTKDGKELKKK